MRSLRDTITPAPRDRRGWVDGPGFGLAVVVSLLAGAVLIALAMGWVR
jgi:hypothetical protein